MHIYSCNEKLKSWLNKVARVSLSTVYILPVCNSRAEIISLVNDLYVFAGDALFSICSLCNTRWRFSLTAKLMCQTSLSLSLHHPILFLAYPVWLAGFPTRPSLCLFPQISSSLINGNLFIFYIALAHVWVGCPLTCPIPFASFSKEIGRKFLLLIYAATLSSLSCAKTRPPIHDY